MGCRAEAEEASATLREDLGLVTSARSTSVKRTTSGTCRPSCLGRRNAVFSRKVLSRPCLCFGQRSTEKLQAKQESVQG